MTAIMATYPTNVVSSESKAAEIHRDTESGRIFYVCFHCGIYFDNIDETLTHIEFHFSSSNDIKIDEKPLDFVDIKYEYLDDASEVVDSSQLQQIFIDCNNKSMLMNEKRNFGIDTSNDVVTPVQQSLTRENVSDVEQQFLLKCLYCWSLFKKFTKLREHLIKHVNDPLPNVIHGSTESETKMTSKPKYSFKCTLCPSEFYDSSSSRQHLKDYHDAIQTDFNSLAETNEHKDIEVEVRGKTEIEKNDRQKTNKKPTVRDTHCNLCNTTFSTWRSMINHRAKQHPETNKMDPLRKDSKFKFEIENNDGHKKKKKPRINDNKGDTYCNLCNTHFLTWHSMINHRSKRHPETNMKDRYKNRPTYYCSICGKTFRNKSNFNRHEKSHTQLHPYTCDICKKTYRLKNSLKTHMLIHTNEKNFICYQCGKSFYTVSKLNLHNQIHENIKLQCDQCDKVFFTRNNFSKHKKTHNDATRKKCKLCNNTFKSNVSLRIHMLLHTGVKKYACRYCDLTFAQSSGRRGHERARHDAA